MTDIMTFLDLLIVRKHQSNTSSLLTVSEFSALMLTFFSLASVFFNSNTLLPDGKCIFLVIADTHGDWSSSIPRKQKSSFNSYVEVGMAHIECSISMNQVHILHRQIHSQEGTALTAPSFVVFVFQMINAGGLTLTGQRSTGKLLLLFFFAKTHLSARSDKNQCRRINSILLVSVQFGNSGQNFLEFSFLFQPRVRGCNVSVDITQGITNEESR